MRELVIGDEQEKKKYSQKEHKETLPKIMIKSSSSNNRDSLTQRLN